MGQTLNGTPTFNIHPGGTRQGFTKTDGYYPQSAGEPIIVSVKVSGDKMTHVPGSPGDIVNVIFKVFGHTIYGDISSAYQNNLMLAECSKSVDIVYENYDNQYYVDWGSATSGDITQKTFTLDIAPFIRPKLSYSLVPCGRGSYNQWLKDGQGWGGLTGTYDRSIYTPMAQVWLLVSIQAEFQVLDSNGELTMATTTSGSSTTKKLRSSQSNNITGGHTGYQFIAINSVRQWGQKQNLQSMECRLNGGTSNAWFMSDCPNSSTTGGTTPDVKMKSMVVEEDSEYLYFYLNQVLRSDQEQDYFSGNNFDSQVWNVFFLVEHRKGGVTYEKQLDTDDDVFAYSVGYNNPNWTSAGDYGGNYYSCRQWFRQCLAQNVSPAWINANGGTIPTDSPAWSNIDNTSDWWRVSVQWQNSENSGGTTGGVCDNSVTNYSSTCITGGGVWTPNQFRRTEYRYFKPNALPEPPAFPYTRVHWLNDLGGIDSYTFTKNKTSSLERSISTYERRPNNPLYQIDQQAFGSMTFGWDENINLYEYSVTNRGEQYQTEQEILEIQMRAKHTCFSEPLTHVDAEWLKGLFRSPNVWIQKTQDTDVLGGSNHHNTRGEFAEYVNSWWHVSENDYFPIIVTNSEIITMDEEQGLIQIQLEYQDGVSQKSQSN